MIPPTHAQALNDKGLTAVSADDCWVFVQNQRRTAAKALLIETRATTFTGSISRLEFGWLANRFHAAMRVATAPAENKKRACLA